jgi:molecular chaperone DnaK
VYQTDKLLADQGDKIDETEKSDVEAAVANVKTALAGTDIEAIKSSTEALMTASQSFSQKLYDAASQEQGEAGGSGQSQVNDDEVVDAEIVDEK